MKFKKLILLLTNMGLKGFLFRGFYELQKRSGLLKKKYPTSYTPVEFIAVDKWRKRPSNFFFNSREDLKEFPLPEKEKATLKKEAEQIKKGNIRFFSGNTFHLGKNYDWITNPENNFQFDINKHWTEIPDLNQEQGDIKFVWEKSRFSYLYTIIRYDFHFKEDQSEFVFHEISDWIDKNPLNMGPNYVCSQEISIRVLNWTFALFYYKNSPTLTQEVFNKILNSIYWQIRHVEANHRFSLISVRNNHAITESLALYSTGVLFPYFDRSEIWKAKGKHHLEVEGFYQIYDDGSYLQFSMNYHRVVIQLYTWAFYLAQANKDTFSTALKERVQRSVQFLYQCQDLTTGQMPNYGANDGALFFPLNNCHFRDYRPQINALFHFYSGRGLYDPGMWNEDLFWFGKKVISEKMDIPQKTRSFSTGGYYVLRSSETYSFIRCGNHKDRPSQADNLHLDLWVKGKNILRDAGSYKYNSTPEDLKFFMGTSSHNTVMLGDHDQMEKGGRFIWFHWSQAETAKVEENSSYIMFTGKIKAFQHISKNIKHTRQVKQFKNAPVWEVTDTIEHASIPAKQIWNISPEFHKEGFEIVCTDKNGNKLEPKTVEGFYSPTYGVKEPSTQIVFESPDNYFKTTISRKKVVKPAPAMATEEANTTADTDSTKGKPRGRKAKPKNLEP
ncbi:MAG TPA: alginate lyase family protein [Cytophagaceae bacterium]